MHTSRCSVIKLVKIKFRIYYIKTNNFFKKNKIEVVGGNKRKLEQITVFF